MLAEPAVHDIRVVPIDAVDLAFTPRPWPFAEDRKQEITAHFADQQARNPALWNGRVLLLYRYEIAADTFCGACLESDFASQMAWRDWGFPDAFVRNCFGMAALRARDGAFLLGVMGPRTANVGRCYFPAGVLDPTDIVGDKVDVMANVRRELAEETGLDMDTLQAATGWQAVFAGPRIALMKEVRADADAETIRARILDHIAREAEPELADVRIVRSAADVDASMPSHTAAFLHHVWNS